MRSRSCCIRHRLPLVALNKKGFVDFRQDRLKLFEPPE